MSRQKYGTWLMKSCLSPLDGTCCLSTTECGFSFSREAASFNRCFNAGSNPASPLASAVLFVARTRASSQKTFGNPAAWPENVRAIEIAADHSAVLLEMWEIMLFQTGPPPAKLQG